MPLHREVFFCFLDRKCYPFQRLSLYNPPLFVILGYDVIVDKSHSVVYKLRAWNVFFYSIEALHQRKQLHGIIIYGINPGMEVKPIGKQKL